MYVFLFLQPLLYVRNCDTSYLCVAGKNSTVVKNKTEGFVFNYCRDIYRGLSVYFFLSFFHKTLWVSFVFLILNNMKVYMGSSKEDFKIQSWKSSRYGFNALVFSSDLYLAQLYAHHKADEEFKRNGGFVYEFELPDYLHIIDYGGKLSYSSDFRNLMFKLFREGHKGVVIKNVIDYPSKRLFCPNYSDIIVVFDFDIIKSFKLIQKNVRVS